MIRRDFIGRLLGTFAGTAIPFKIEDPNPTIKTEKDILYKYDRLIRTFKLAESNQLNIVEKYSTNLIIDIQGERGTIKSPGIESIIFYKDEHTVIIDFTLKEIKIITPLTVIGCQIIDDEQHKLRDLIFPFPVWTTDRDTLKIKAKLQLQ